MARGDLNSTGQGKALDQLTQSNMLTVLSRILSVGGWAFVFVVASFLIPKGWDFIDALAENQKEVSDNQRDLAHSLDRISWRLGNIEVHNERQDRHLEHNDKEIERLKRSIPSRHNYPPWPTDSGPSNGR